VLVDNNFSSLPDCLYLSGRPTVVLFSLVRLMFTDIKIINIFYHDVQLYLRETAPLFISLFVPIDWFYQGFTHFGVLLLNYKCFFTTCFCGKPDDAALIILKPYLFV